MTKKEIARFLILKTIGNFLVLFALFGFFATFGPALYYEVYFRIAQAKGVRYVVLNTPEKTETANLRPATKSFGDLLSGPLEKILVPKDTQFSIVIPKIGASEKIIPNVDSSNEDEFLTVLQKGVAHTKGSVFPGISGTTYLFAHSTDNFWNVGRYNAVFYLLKDLGIGDDVIIFFENERHNYKVVDSKIIEADDVSHLIKSQEGGEEKVILQTCWPPGTTWKRLIVTAKPK